MIEYLSGAVTLGYVIAALFFLRFWRRTGERLFCAFGIAFVLFALNQAAAQWIGAADERVGYTYVLRVAGFLVILGAIIDKNLARKRRP